MPATPTIPPRRRPELIIQQSGPGGDYVVKDPTKRTYFQIGQQEAFLLEQLDGAKDADAICQQFQSNFKNRFPPKNSTISSSSRGSSVFSMPKNRPAPALSPPTIACAISCIGGESSSIPTVSSTGSSCARASSFRRRSSSCRWRGRLGRGDCLHEWRGVYPLYPTLVGGRRVLLADRRHRDRAA